MMFYKRGETVVCRFIFQDVVTGETIDVDTPQYTIDFYVGSVVTNVVTLADLTKVPGTTGIYICSWEIPEDAVENMSYFVTASGIHPVRSTSLILGDMFRVIPITYFGDASNTGVTAKFTKP